MPMRLCISSNARCPRSGFVLAARACNRPILRGSPVVSTAAQAAPERQFCLTQWCAAGDPLAATDDQRIREGCDGVRRGSGARDPRFAVSRVMRRRRYRRGRCRPRAAAAATQGDNDATQTAASHRGLSSHSPGRRRPAAVCAVGGGRRMGQAAWVLAGPSGSGSGMRARVTSRPRASISRTW